MIDKFVNFTLPILSLLAAAGCVYLILVYVPAFAETWEQTDPLTKTFLITVCLLALSISLAIVLYRKKKQYWTRDNTNPIDKYLNE